MGDLLIGVGILLAIIGPLLLIPVAWLLYRYAMRPLVVRIATPALSTDSARGLALGITVGLLAAVIAASYFPGKQQFDALCAQHSQPQIGRRVYVEGFYADKLFPYQAAAYIRDQGFTFVEAPDPYEDGVYLRYTFDGSKTHSEVIEAPTSLFGFRQTFSEISGSITMTEKVIYETSTDSELARAVDLVYMGGPLSLFLGSYAMSSCPDLRTAKGSEDFNTFYNLETLVLHSR
ncbi:MAG: hypothetical protein O3A53_05175 [Acidobacteria bacterium]|nr:hypothetical protein [Acidobacteriota bacterium]